MDPATIATGAIAILSPYLAKSAEEFAKSMGKDSYEQVKKLKNWLWQKISKSKDDKLKRTKDLFASDPETFKDPMVKLLADYLAQNPKIASELNQLLAPFAGNQPGKYVTNISGGTIYGFSIGDNPSTTQIIGPEK